MSELSRIFEFGNLTDRYVNFGIVSVLGILIALVVFLVLTEKRYRIESLRNLGVVSKRTGGIISAIIAILFVYYAHKTNFWVFHKLKLSDSSIELEYHFPVDHIEIPCDEIESVERGRGVDGIHKMVMIMGYRVVIVTKTGALYKSAADYRSDKIEKAIEAINNCKENSSE